MSNLLKIPFNKIRSEGNYKEIFEALERGFSKFGIDFYLVGATARESDETIDYSRSLISLILDGIKFRKIL